MPPYRHRQRVRFGDVDHAGIVYYPHFFHYFHMAFEDLFGDGQYRRILDERHVGFPAVHVECDFHRPLRYGDDVTIEVSTTRVGGKSVTFRYVVTRGDEPGPCAEARVTCAAIDLRTFVSLELPDDLRRLFESLAAAPAC